MYPYPILFGMTLYEWMMILGFFLAVITLRIHSDRRGYPAAFQNLAILGGTVGICFGYFFAVLFQAFYNYLDSGIFSLNQSTGATFYGGLIGGVAIFFLIYFGVGAIVYRGKENQTLTLLPELCNIGISGVVIAHACGRLGCLFAGCCHGAIVDGFPGIFNHAVNAYTIPIPLYEALFLFLLYGVMTVGLLKKKGNLLVLYLVSYGVWRFFIEYLRTDERGQTIIPFLSPSQLISLLMILLAAVLYFLPKFTRFGRFNKKSPLLVQIEGDNGENSVENGENLTNSHSDKDEK